MTKFAIASEAETIVSHYVDQKNLFQFLLQNIDKIKRATLPVLSNLVLPHILDMVWAVPKLKCALDASRYLPFQSLLL